MNAASPESVPERPAGLRHPESRGAAGLRVAGADRRPRGTERYLRRLRRKEARYLRGLHPMDPGRRRRSRLLMASGATALVAGVALIGWAVFQTWESNTATDRAQESLIADFAQSLTRPDQRTSTDPVSGTETAVASDLPEDPISRDDPVMIAPSGSGARTVDETARYTGIVDEPAPPRGSAVGRILVPEAGIDWMIVEGVEASHLRQGPGHMPGTAVPGQPGNAVISGHRTTNGAPFRDLDELEPGDHITVETLIGTHTYQVRLIRIVTPDAMWVTTQWAGGWLTLTTCHPENSSSHRMIVFAQLVDGPNLAAIDAASNRGIPTAHPGLSEPGPAGLQDEPSA